MDRKSLALVVGSLWSVTLHATDYPNEYGDVYSQVSQYCGVPAEILYSVSMVESGRRQNGQVTPWPWTLNIEGKGFYFEDREAMYAAVMTAIKDEKSVDIGLMQANWHWKFAALDGSAWLATDPVFNVKAGCEILSGLHAKYGDWWTAVGKYHRESNKPKHRRAANQYAQRVFTQLDRLQ